MSWRPPGRLIGGHEGVKAFTRNGKVDVNEVGKGVASSCTAKYMCPEVAGARAGPLATACPHTT